jgi:hypothetical protein
MPDIFIKKLISQPEQVNREDVGLRLTKGVVLPDASVRVSCLGWEPSDLLAWLQQWHNEFDPEVSSGLGDYFAGFLDEEARKQGTTVEALKSKRFGYG